MAKATQFCVGLDNKPGTLGKMCGVLTRAQVSIQAISVSADGECGWVRFLARPATRARAALNRARYQFCTRRVLSLSVTHEPGTIERVATQLAKARINIDYVYGSNPRVGPSSILVLGVSDLDRAAKLLRD